ncbi:MAG: hypothetical protein EKK42_26840 [Pseudonocardiaceae bacterium]|nr:MAG: hypothetical protein EKK42_26840 [Pseudonocardiaceae bacterium]
MRRRLVAALVVAVGVVVGVVALTRPDCTLTFSTTHAPAPTGRALRVRQDASHHHRAQPHGRPGADSRP